MFTPNANEISSAIAEHDLREFLAKHSVRINSNLAAISLNSTTIYCAKTGAPIGEMSREVLARSLQSLGAEKFTEVMFRANIHGINPEWLFSDPENLDILIESDPLGYACFALNLLTRHYLKRIPKNDLISAAEHHWSLARAWQWLKLLSPELLNDLCDNLCGALTYAPYTITFITAELHKTTRSQMPDKLAQMAVEGTFCELLKNATDYALASLGRYDITKKYKHVPATPADAAKGPSNVRGQKVSRNRVSVDQTILTAMSGYGAALFENDEDKGTYKPKFSSKHKSLLVRIQTSSHAPRTEQPIINDEMLDLASDFDFTPDFDDDETDDENTVEVRVISRSLLETEITEIPPVNLPAPIKRETLAEKLAKIAAEKLAREPAKPAEVHIARPGKGFKPNSLLNRLVKGN